MLEFSHVTKHYDSRTVLDDVTFDVKAGWVTGLVGPNGSGKTTLARILLGLAAADSGSVRIDGLPLVVRATGIPPELPPRTTVKLKIAEIDSEKRFIALSYVNAVV